MADCVSRNPVRKILKRNPLSGSFHSYVLVSVYVLVNRKERIGLSPHPAPHHHLSPGPCGSSGGPRGCRPHYCLGSPIHYDGDGTGKNPYRNTVDQNIYKADAMIYYRIPVIRDIVKLRAGAGVGV